MAHRFRTTIALLALAAGVFGTVLAADKGGFVDTFSVKAEDFASTGRNDYFVLEPGYQLVFEGTEDGKPGRLVITVLDKTRKIDGVETRVIEEHETVAGKVEEVSRNFFAIDKNTNDVYYFGEEVDEYKNDKITGHGGSWRSGKNGAHYGLFMPAKPAVGQKFAQELAPKEAMDRCEVESVTEKISVPAGEFDNCVKIKETTPLEADTVEHKAYAPKVGQVIDGGLKLVKFGVNVEPMPARPAAPRAVAPPLQAPWAREALAMVGSDPDAEFAWANAINDPGIPAHERSDLIEDLNEQGFADPHNVSADELPVVLNRMALIEQMAPDAMDETNAAAFAEAYKDLANIADKLMGAGQ